MRFTRHLIICISVFFLGSKVSGQDLLLLSSDSSYMESNAFLGVSGEFDVRSNALNNLFLDRMYFGGFIDENLKDQISADLTNQNRLGAEIGGKINYWSFSDSLFNNPNIGLLLNIEQRFDGYLSFTDDLFELVYRGNSAYAGQTADLSRLHSGVYVYQKYGGGIFNKKNLSSLRLSMVNGQSFFQTDITDASFYTDPDLDSIVVNYLGDVQFSDSSRTSLSDNNGIGAAIDLNANIPLKDKSGFIKVRLNNLGFIRWNSNTHIYEADTSVTYSGIDIQDLFNDSQGGYEIPNLADTLAYDSKKERVTTFLPGSASVSLVKKIKEDNFFEVGVMVIGNRAYIPKIYAGYKFMLTENSIISATGSYGGYGRMRIGGHYEKMYRGWYLIIGSEDIPGLFLRDLNGKGGYFSLGKFIGKK